jgi:hypothetical protein
MDPREPVGENATSEEIAGPAVMDVVRDQLAQERAIKSSLEARAGGVITSSGTLVTLLLAIIGLVSGPGGVHLAATAKALIVGSLVGFLAAAVLAMLAVRPRAYSGMDRADLKAISTEGAWKAPSTYAGPRIAGALVSLIDRSRDMNRIKAAQLGWAIRAEVGAIVFLGGAVAAVLLVA